MDQPSLWWNHVSGAARYLDDTVSAASGHRVVLLEEAPFMEHFLQLLQDKLLLRDPGLHIETSDADDWSDNPDVGEALMARYAPQVEYHPMDGSRAEIIASRQVLAGRVVIVRRAERHRGWIDLAVEYGRQNGARSGLLMLTYGGSSPLAGTRRGVAALKWDTYVTMYDMQLFASYCVADRPGLSPALRGYVTQLASRLAGGDPALCSLLATGELAADVIGSLRRAGEQNESAARLSEDPKYVQHVMWEAQIQTVFPIVERTRRRFIESYYEGLRGVLPQEDEFKNTIAAPEDMELRHMWFYYFRAVGAFRSPEDERLFRLCYKARNELAHLDPLDSRTVLDIFELDQAGSAVGRR